MTWVPSYNRDVSKSMIQSQFGGYGPSTGLSRIGLQWWSLTTNGDLRRVEEFGKINDEEISFYTDWAKGNDIKVLLCIYNGVKEWDWSLAKKGFIENKNNLIQQLVNEVDKYHLDGIDVDLEGLVPTNKKERQKFKSFIKELSLQLRKRGKLLTVDTFHSPLFNSPNLSWWEDWVGDIDGVHSMGYQDLFEGSTHTFNHVSGYLFRYSWQQNYGLKLGYKPSQIFMGLPSDVNSWGSGGVGTTALNHIHECINSGSSIAIWDIQLLGGKGQHGWQSAEVWKTLTKFVEKE